MLSNFCECDNGGLDTATKWGIFAAVFTTIAELVTLYMANKNNTTLQNKSGIMEELEYYRSESRDLRGELIATRNRVGELEEFLSDLQFVDDPNESNLQEEEAQGNGEEE